MFAKGYVLGAGVVGLLTILWGIIVLQGPVQFWYTIMPPGDSGTNCLQVICLIERIWMLVSLLAIVLFIIGKKPLFSPVSFFVYYLVTWVMWAALPMLITLAQALNFEVHVPLPIRSIIMSPVIGFSMGIAGILFGIFYATINFRLWKKLIAENKS